MRTPEPTRPAAFHDGGPIGPVAAPDLAAPPQVLLERVTTQGPHGELERFRLLRRLAYRDAVLGEVLVPRAADWETDLTSVPTIFTWLVPRTGEHLPPALVHDALVGRGRPAYLLDGVEPAEVVDRVEADRVFRAAMKDSGTRFVRRWLVWSAVTLATILGGSTSLTGARRLRYLVPMVGSLGLIAVLGVVATLDILDLPGGSWVGVPWIPEASFWGELAAGLAGAVAVPVLLGLTWGRFAVAGVVTGLALAVLLHVTVVIVAILGVYRGAERVAVRAPRAGQVGLGLLLAASIIATVTLTLSGFGTTR